MNESDGELDRQLFEPVFEFDREGRKTMPDKAKNMLQIYSVCPETSETELQLIKLHSGYI